MLGPTEDKGTQAGIRERLRSPPAFLCRWTDRSSLLSDTSKLTTCPFLPLKQEKEPQHFVHETDIILNANSNWRQKKKGETLHRGQTVLQRCCYQTWMSLHPSEFLRLSGPTSLLCPRERALSFFYCRTWWDLLDLEIKIHEAVKRDDHSDVCEGHTLAAFLFLPLTFFHLAHQPIKAWIFLIIQQPSGTSPTFECSAWLGWFLPAHWWGGVPPSLRFPFNAQLRQ